ncbi:MAG: DUF108 domain-containing protein [Lachnospiraceae bacterium]|nr:DUF108 domain-containing protein [Lachnospiraceae bacterium]
MADTKIQRKRAVLIGCGNLGSVIAAGIADSLSDHWELAGIVESNEETARAAAQKYGCRICGDAESIAGLCPDIVIEAAGPAVLRIYAEAVLGFADLMPLSIGAFADEEFYKAVQEKAAANGHRIHIVSGAIGGLDLMQSVLFAGSLHAEIITEKGPDSLKGAPWFDEHPLDETKENTVFSGDAVEAIKGFPKNVNVAVACALATTGTRDISVVIDSIPGKTLNTHRIILNGDFGRASIEIESRPTPDNPRSSTLAAYSVLARLKNMTDTVSFI